MTQSNSEFSASPGTSSQPSTSTHPERPIRHKGSTPAPPGRPDSARPPGLGQSEASIHSEFLSAMRRLGLTPPDRVLSDGKIHRFRSGPEHALNGFYRLVVVPAHQGGDVGFGLIGCWKRDVSEKWCSLRKDEITEYDRAAMERARAEMKRDDEKAAVEAERKAAAIWKSAGPAPADHPYLVRKKIEPKGLKLYKDMLVVPAYRGGKLASLQFIGADGVKRFLKGGRMDGAYASVSGGADRSKILIAEGYATAGTLHEATGVPVVVAFNAGNLVAVSKAIRAKYPDAELILAADDDRHTVVRGELLNVGVVKARAAAEAVGGTVMVPQFLEDDPEKASDWNDLASLRGLEAVRGAFQVGKPDPGLAAMNEPKQPAAAVPHDAQGRRNSPEATRSPGPPDPSYHPASRALGTPQFGDWRARLIPGKESAEGHPFPFDGKSKTNAYMFLKHHDRFDGVLCYNEFTDAVMIMRRPPWEDSPDFAPRPIRDDDFFMLAAHLEYCDISVSKDTAADAAVRVAKERSINPPREYLSRLEWDGVPRLDRWLTYYLGADGQPAEYLALVGAKWLIGAVSRVFRPGSKFDSVLILEGAQGLGKSMALRALATFGGQDFFLDSVGDIRSKDTLMTMQGKLIVEIAELASFKKSENEEIKAFISRQVDEYRPPYGRTVVKRPRFFVLAGSTNELEEGYLTDDTGNRRYWPVKCNGIDAEALGADAPQLWAEAVRRYHSGERTWLTPEEAHFSSHEQKSRFLEDAWQERISEIVKHHWMGIRLDEVLDKLEMKPRDINNLVKKRVKNSLRQLGWHETRRAGEGRMWRPMEKE